MRNARAKLIALVAFTALGAGRAVAAPDTSLVGIYLCSGAGPSGAAYEGLVEIAQHEDTFRLQWVFPEERRIVIGLGVRKDDVLAVMYFGEDPGLVTYQIEEERLVGTWTTLAAQGHVFTETLTRTSGVQLPVPESPPAPAERPELLVPAATMASR